MGVNKVWGVGRLQACVQGVILHLFVPRQQTVFNFSQMFN